MTARSWSSSNSKQQRLRFLVIAYAHIHSCMRFSFPTHERCICFAWLIRCAAKQLLLLLFVFYFLLFGFAQPRKFSYNFVETLQILLTFCINIYSYSHTLANIYFRLISQTICGYFWMMLLAIFTMRHWTPCRCVAKFLYEKRNRLRSPLNSNY